MDRYHMIPRSREPIKDDEIRITSEGRVLNYLNYALRLFEEQKRSSLTIKATGNAINRAIALAETIKRRFKGLHQITKCGSTTITTMYEPNEEGLKQVRNERAVSFLELTLSKEPLDESDPGYQPPLDDSMVTEFTEEELQQFRQKGYFKPYGRGKFLPNRGGRGLGFRNSRRTRNRRQNGVLPEGSELPNGSGSRDSGNVEPTAKNWVNGMPGGNVDAPPQVQGNELQRRAPRGYGRGSRGKSRGRGRGGRGRGGRGRGGDDMNGIPGNFGKL